MTLHTQHSIGTVRHWLGGDGAKHLAPGAIQSIESLKACCRLQCSAPYEVWTQPLVGIQKEVSGFLLIVVRISTCVARCKSTDKTLLSILSLSYLKPWLLTEERCFIIFKENDEYAWWFSFHLDIEVHCGRVLYYWTYENYLSIS